MTHITTYSRNYDSLDGMIDQTDRHLNTIENTSLRQLHPKPADRGPLLNVSLDPVKTTLATGGAYVAGLWQDVTQIQSRKVYTLEHGIKTPATDRWILGRGLIVTIAILGLFSIVNFNSSDQPDPTQPIANPINGTSTNNPVVAMLTSNPLAMSATGGAATKSTSNQTNNSGSSWIAGTSSNTTNQSSNARSVESAQIPTSDQAQTGGRGGDETGSAPIVDTTTPIIDTSPVTVTPSTPAETNPIIDINPTPTEDEPVIDVTLPPLLDLNMSNQSDSSDQVQTQSTTPTQTSDETSSDASLIQLETPVLDLSL